MTDQEMIEWRKVFNIDRDKKVFSNRYKELDKKFQISCQKDKVKDATRLYYWNICYLVDNDIPDEEILAMSNEQRMTYVYLFDLQFRYE